MRSRPMTTLRLLLVAAAAASALLPSPSPLRSPPTTDAALRVATSGCAGEAVPSALYAHLGQDRVATAAALGRISSSAALLDILVTPQLGRLSDTIGRKPLLVGAPALALLCRGVAASRPTIRVLVIVKLLSLLLTSTFSVALRASIADTHRDDPAALTGKLGLVVGPTLYGYLFGLGCSVGVPALPFLFATAVSLSATALVLASPSHVWDPPPQPPAARDAGGGGGSGSGDLAAGSGGAGGSGRGGGS
ncbi:hypothetical protein EMIHUDRAFT_113091 [Emiliania huxleyi CCMP1516]|uniref:Major facilitator superfamily (MFS) profile domain-containing protein n=2 Tax=Emiliania huxleyi TaxID=2903 RepID=A0A0D3K501_EMIH1|nr:hypothetical protein EMIHUDRAFT_113091 [Emiliania huxleyi CCMP1516]EOD30836.1 hypothetical protein EMIHUDRAFT_113091 [Emiliania huxleyi CCMP1516]|eukprot:XP_005783265.1 hypothetical protein EMIHUDRAFT_113091 [Emiliania huxleyi CCMP1516]